MTDGFSRLIPGLPASRFRLAVVLLLMFATILAGKFWEDAYIASLERDCGSLFTDRLMPATTLYYLGDRFHDKRETLEAYLDGALEPGEPSLDYRLGQSDAAIEGLLHDIQQTYLVAEESIALSALREAIDTYDQHEAALIERHRAGERIRHDAGLREAFSRVRAELTALTRIQEEVGHELSRASATSASQVTSLLYFQLGVTFVLGLLASGLAMSLEGRSSSPPPPPPADEPESPEPPRLRRLQ